jgi:hypothetical protein
MLSDLIRPMQLTAVHGTSGNLVTTIIPASGRMQ